MTVTHQFLEEYLESGTIHSDDIRKLLLMIPPEAVGSEQALEDWLNDKDQIRTKFNEKLEQQKFMDKLSEDAENAEKRKLYIYDGFPI